MTQKENIHFIGIGIGTSALIRWFLSQGYSVSGSDIKLSSIIQELRSLGVKIKIGHKAQNLPKVSKLVIFSAAIMPDNPELLEAQKLNIPIQSYAQALGQLVRLYSRSLAVAGAHGKSTTTALLASVLLKAGRRYDPTVIIGTKLSEFSDGLYKNGSNFRFGKSDFLIFEADEYKRSFLNYQPFGAIITNIDKEHLDYYKNLKEIKNVFLQFIKNIQKNGVLVLNRDDANLLSLKNKIENIARKRNIKIFWYSIFSKNCQKQLQYLKKHLKIIGQHNLSNALGVYMLTKYLGIPEKNIYLGIRSYKGAWRRMEYRGTIYFPPKQVKADIYDDYAHHPTEIKATLSAFAQQYPRKKIICVFEPHQSKRLQSLFEDFINAFDSAHFLILLDVYRVVGRDEKEVSQNINSKQLFLQIEKHVQLFSNQKKKNKLTNFYLERVFYLPRSPFLFRKLKKSLQSAVLFLQGNFKTKISLVIIMMGAGEINNYTSKILQSFHKR